VTENNV